MNRTIKFRAWDIKRNRWLDEFQVMPNGTVRYRLPVEESPDRLEWQEMKDIILLQFTGLHDKNGKEIYEGDILRWIDWEQEGVESWDRYIVRYEPCSFLAECFRDGKRLDGEDPMDKEDIGHFEIMGNIYENPDLL